MAIYTRLEALIICDTNAEAINLKTTHPNIHSFIYVIASGDLLLLINGILYEINKNLKVN